MVVSSRVICRSWLVKTVLQPLSQSFPMLSRLFVRRSGTMCPLVGSGGRFGMDRWKAPLLRTDVPLGMNMLIGWYGPRSGTRPLAERRKCPVQPVSAKRYGWDDLDVESARLQHL